MRWRGVPVLRCTEQSIGTLDGYLKGATPDAALREPARDGAADEAARSRDAGHRRRRSPSSAAKKRAAIGAATRPPDDPPSTRTAIATSPRVAMNQACVGGGSPPPY